MKRTNREFLQYLQVKRGAHHIVINGALFEHIYTGVLEAGTSDRQVDTIV